MAIKFFDAVGFITVDNKGLEKGLKQSKKSLGKAVKAASKLALGFGVGIGAALTGAIFKAQEFNEVMAEVNTLGVENVELLAEGVRDIAAEFGKAPTEVARGLYETISATGLDAAEALDLLSIATKASIAGISDVNAAVDLGTGVMNAFGLSIGDMSTIFDQAFVAVKRGKTTFSELAVAVGRVAPIMSAAGLASNEMFASLTALTKSGISTNEAVTGLRAVINAIIAPTGEAVKEAKKLELAFDAEALASEGLAGFLDDVQEATGGNITKMRTLFGGVEALGTALVLSGVGAADMAEALADMADNTGQMNTAFDAFVEANPGFAFDQLKSSITNLAIEIGNALLPKIADLAKNLTPVVKGITKWAKDNPGLATSVVVLAAGTAALAISVGAVGLALPVMVTGLAGVAAGLAAMGLAVTPAGLALGFLALGAAFVFATVNAKGLAAELRTLKRALDAFIGHPFGFLAGLLQPRIPALDPTPDFGNLPLDTDFGGRGNSTTIQRVDISVQGGTADADAIANQVVGLLLDLGEAGKFSREGVQVTP